MVGAFSFAVICVLEQALYPTKSPCALLLDPVGVQHGVREPIIDKLASTAPPLILLLAKVFRPEGWSVAVLVVGDATFVTDCNVILVRRLPPPAYSAGGLLCLPVTVFQSLLFVKV